MHPVLEGSNTRNCKVTSPALRSLGMGWQRSHMNEALLHTCQLLLISGFRRLVCNSIHLRVLVNSSTFGTHISYSAHMICGETEPHIVQEVKAVTLFPGTCPTSRQRSQTQTRFQTLHVTKHVFMRQTLPTFSTAHTSFEAQKNQPRLQQCTSSYSDTLPRTAT